MLDYRGLGESGQAPAFDDPHHAARDFVNKIMEVFGVRARMGNYAIPVGNRYASTSKVFEYFRLFPFGLF